MPALFVLHLIDILYSENDEKYEVKGLADTSYDSPEMYKIKEKLNESENTVKLTAAVLWALNLDRITVSDEPVKYCSI